VERGVATSRCRLVHVVGPFDAGTEHRHIARGSHRQRAAAQAHHGFGAGSEQLDHPVQRDAARRDQVLEILPRFDYPPNLEVNAAVNHSWKEYVQRPSLLKEIAYLDRLALFVYGKRDIRPSWPVEQVAQLLPNATFQMVADADHHIWVTHPEELQTPLRAFVQQIAQAERQ